MRTVTKYRTATRDVTTPVTRYRDVPHSFTYEATEQTGTYSSALHARLDGGVPEVVVTVAIDARYAELHCAKPHHTIEDAAACAYLDPKRTPPAARASLRTVFGDDEPFLASVLAR
jgi:hypothetical protein